MTNGDDRADGLDDDKRRLVTRERAQWRARVVAARSRFSADHLIGMTVPQARAVVERAGGEFATFDGPIAAKVDPNRVVATVDGGRVASVSIG